MEIIKKPEFADTPWKSEERNCIQCPTTVKLSESDVERTPSAPCDDRSPQYGDTPEKFYWTCPHCLQTNTLKDLPLLVQTRIRSGRILNPEGGLSDEMFGLGPAHSQGGS